MATLRLFFICHKKEDVVDYHTKLFDLPYQYYMENHQAKVATDSRRVPGSNASNVQPLSSAKAAIPQERARSRTLQLAANPRSYDTAEHVTTVMQIGREVSLICIMSSTYLIGPYCPRFSIRALFAAVARERKVKQKAWTGLVARGTASQCYCLLHMNNYLSFVFLLMQESSEVFQ